MGDAVLEARELRYSYPKASSPAVDGMSFSVARGEIFGFLGPSGAGKTTTQRILVGLLDGFEGDARLLGRARSAWGRELYDRIGVSFELPAAYEKLTGRENLQHFANLHETPTREPGELLADLRLEESADLLVAGFSKGMRMRLNLALALLHRPEVLFLDEPTGGLDPGTARRVREVLLAERDRGATLFLTTHDMTLADAVCDRVAFVLDGRIAACDSPRALKLAAGRRQIRVEYRDEAGGVASRTVPLDAASGLAELLASKRIETIHSAEASLDDVFVEVTGAQL